MSGGMEGQDREEDYNERHCRHHRRKDEDVESRKAAVFAAQPSFSDSQSSTPAFTPTATTGPTTSVPYVREWPQVDRPTQQSPGVSDNTIRLVLTGLKEIGAIGNITNDGCRRCRTGQCPSLPRPLGHDDRRPAMAFRFGRVRFRAATAAEGDLLVRSQGPAFVSRTNEQPDGDRNDRHQDPTNNRGEC